jgi:two-component system chemotaxis sensor kinase CheA
VVHDVSKELGKEIALHISGAETELDKTVVEKIGDPLTHLVRNAIDHGIEPSELRVARGKPAKGTLQLNAYHDSGSIVIEVADDGGGLCRDKILKKAIERGLVNEGDNLSDKEILNLIFEPGFSTADQISNLSGRGVGMDVVRRNIVALRGSVDLDSEEGKGTIIRIRLPLTLAIIDGFLVKVGNASFVIPLDLVVECIELSQEDRRAASERNYISLRGQVLPYLNLREIFDVDGDRARRENLVVVQYGGCRVGLVVDVLLGEIQTVIKPLGRMFSQVNGIGGSTILGNGTVALILDVPALARQVSAEAERAMAEARTGRKLASAQY